MDFIGGQENFPALGYGVCDLTADPNREKLGEVRFSYSPDQAVTLSPMAAIELQRDGETIESVTPLSPCPYRTPVYIL